MISLEGNWILITGTNGGVGREIVKSLSNKKCGLVLHVHN